MALVTIKGGAQMDVPNRAEIAEIVSAQLRELYRGVKVLRIPLITGTASGSALSIGQAQVVGPDSGYAWSVRRMVVSGMTTGVTPDVANLYVNSTTSPPLWQFNGNNFGYSFNDGELVINPGEIMLLASVGTFAATGLITVSGQVVEVPAEMLGKLAFA
jgi:hypothetical protein